MTSSVVSNEIYVILGATGNTGSIIANSLLSAGKKVRVVGRDSGRLQRFVDKGAEAFTADMSDAAALAKAFSGARAAYLMLPPAKSREEQERDSDAIAKAVKESGLRYAVHLSSYGAQVAEGAGPVSGLHSSEQKLNAIEGLNVLHLRAAYFMENNLAAIGMIQAMGIFGNALRPDLKIPMAATRDVGDYAAQRLLRLDFPGKQTRELLGERDLSMTEATAVISRAIGKPDLRYQQFPYDQVQKALTQLGVPPKGAAMYIEMYKSINAGVLVPLEPRSRENTTPTSFEQFVQDVFAPAYRGKAQSAYTPVRHRLRPFAGEGSGGINDNNKGDAAGIGGHGNQCPGRQRVFHRGHHLSAIPGSCRIRSNTGVVDIGDVRGGAHNSSGFVRVLGDLRAGGTCAGAHGCARRRHATARCRNRSV